MQRVAVGMFFTECNHLGGVALTPADFERKGVLAGDELLAALGRGDAPPVLIGVYEELVRRGKAVVPLVKAEAFCGGPLTAACWKALRDRMLAALRDAGPVDGVVLAMHGSAVADNALDPEGELLERTRKSVGRAAAIVATLDHHANVTRKMIENADALVAWETYPYNDTRETGVRGARLLCDTLDGAIRPTMAFAKAPVLVSGCNAQTEWPGPFADLMRASKKLEGAGGVLSANMILAHPYLDVPELGGGAIVITDNDASLARSHAVQLARDYWARRFDLEAETHTPQEAIRRGMAIDGGPVLLVETADCIGGGAAGDSVAALAALLRLAPSERAIAPVVDPDAVAVCKRAGVGAAVSLTLGHKLSPKWGLPIAVRGLVERLHDGAFTYDGGIWGGVRSTMGDSAVLRVGEARVLVTSLPTYDWKDEQYRAVGLEWANAKFVVIKNPMNYRLTLAPAAKAVFILDTPGPTPPTLKHVPYKRLRRPYFPADTSIASFEPIVYESRARV